MMRKKKLEINEKDGQAFLWNSYGKVFIFNIVKNGIGYYLKEKIGIKKLKITCRTFGIPFQDKSYEEIIYSLFGDVIKEKGEE